MQYTLEVKFVAFLTLIIQHTFDHIFRRATSENFHPGKFAISIFGKWHPCGNSYSILRIVEKFRHLRPDSTRQFKKHETIILANYI